MTAPIEIFFSYAHDDEKLMDNFRRQLVLFERQGMIQNGMIARFPPVPIGEDISIEMS